MLFYEHFQYFMQIQCKVRIRGGTIINTNASRELPKGTEFPVLQADILDEKGEAIQGSVIQIPLSPENRGIVGHITEVGTLIITVP